MAHIFMGILLYFFLHFFAPSGWLFFIDPKIVRFFLSSERHQAGFRSAVPLQIRSCTLEEKKIIQVIIYMSLLKSKQKICQAEK